MDAVPATLLAAEDSAAISDRPERISYTMTAHDAIEPCRLVRPRTAIPIHCEGWKHFRQGRETAERELAQAPEDVRRRIRWLPIGAAVEIASS